MSVTVLVPMPVPRSVERELRNLQTANFLNAMVALVPCKCACKCHASFGKNSLCDACFQTHWHAKMGK